jgi:hypothetical protein
MVEFYEKIYEYELMTDGTILTRTPALEIREIDGVRKKIRLAYVINEHGKISDTLYRDTFWDITKATRVFRFIDDNVQKHKEVLLKELHRRSAKLMQQADELRAKAEHIAKVAENISIGC